MELPTWLYDWLYPEIPINAKLRSKNDMDDPKRRARVLRLERGRYNNDPPRYSRQWYTNAIMLPYFSFLTAMQVLKGRILYRM